MESSRFGGHDDRCAWCLQQSIESHGRSDDGDCTGKHLDRHGDDSCGDHHRRDDDVIDIDNDHRCSYYNHRRRGRTGPRCLHRGVQRLLEVSS